MQIINTYNVYYNAIVYAFYYKIILILRIIIVLFISFFLFIKVLFDVRENIVRISPSSGLIIWKYVLNAKLKIHRLYFDTFI